MYRRRRVFRRKPRRYKRKGLKRRFYRKKNRVFNVKRMTFQADIVPTGASTFGTFTFSLGLLPNNGEFTSMFQHYRINCVVLKFIPQYNNADTAAATANRLPVMHMATDYNSIAPWLSANDAFQYQNLKTVRTGGPFSHKIYPRYLTDVFQSVASVSALSARRGWISTDAPAVQHYGLKYFLDSGGASSSTIKVYAKYYLSFKNVK